MKKDHSKYKSNIRNAAAAFAMGVVSAVILTGCTPEAFNIGQAAEGGSDSATVSDAVIYSSYSYLPVGTYDSADTAILKTINEEDRTITLYNTLAAKTYTLNYDGTTYASDKYGTTMSMAQMTEGTIVNVNFYKATKQLVNIQISPDAWTYEDITRFDLGGINSTATIGDRTYALTKGVQVFSEGRQTDLLSIVDGDTITVSGIGYDIYSIKVNSGHGYVRLNNDEALVGGWVEIGGTLITQISEPGMLLTVPEGTYTVRMYNDNSSVTQEIHVERNQEIILDCSGVTAPEETIGRIIFHLTPDNATLTMDGTVRDTSGIINAEYGVHEIVVSAPGYDTLSRYVNVGNELSEISIILDETKTYISDNSSNTVWDNLFGNNKTGSGNSSSGNSASRNSTSGNASSANSASANKKTVTANGYNRVYIYYPDSVEVYVDGIYAGLTPMSFKKTAGSHTIILKKAGYETRSYTIYLYDDKEDMSISFSELEAVSTGSSDTSGSSSGSGTGTDGSSSGSSSNTGTVTDSTSGTGDNTGSSSSTGSEDRTDGSGSSTEDADLNGAGTGVNAGTGSGTDSGTDSTGQSSNSSDSDTDYNTGGNGNDTDTSTNQSDESGSGRHNTENP
ncbi:MAG: PEGA domain-containing protein [Lachnospiraceae bacterium]|nr:PEGA domain-containing protein [Lachnospiraceae bacterium]